MNSENFTIVIIAATTFAGMVLLGLVILSLTKFLAKGINTYRAFCKTRFSAKLQEYVENIDGEEVAGVIKFTTYAGILLWTDQYTWTIPVVQHHSEAAEELLGELAGMTYKYALLGYGAIFIPFLVWIDKYRKTKQIRAILST